MRLIVLRDISIRFEMAYISHNTLLKHMSQLRVWFAVFFLHSSILHLSQEGSAHQKQSTVATLKKEECDKDNGAGLVVSYDLLCT